VVSPKLRPPQAVTLPINFDKLPSQVPPSSVSSNTLHQIQTDTEGFVRSMGERHDVRVKAYHDWRDQVNKQEVQEKRRIAPGYLDSGAKILTPQMSGPQVAQDQPGPAAQNNERDQENELDKVFGRVSLK
jgi:hypothetical protein